MKKKHWLIILAVVCLLAGIAFGVIGVMRSQTADEYSDLKYLGRLTFEAYAATQEEDGTYTIFLNGCSVLRSADGDYIQYENILYLLSDSYNFSDIPEKNVLRFVIQLDGSLCFDSELDLCAPNRGDIFKRQNDQ